jgi:hypothetical protein
MSLIFATAVSRLHADLIIVRLKQAGVPTTQISVIHPITWIPNSAACWLEGSAQVALSSGTTVSISGGLSEKLANHPGRTMADLSKKLRKLGLNAEEYGTVEETLLENRFVLTVDLAKGEMPRVVMDILRKVTAEKIIVLGDNCPAGHLSTFETQLAADGPDLGLSLDFKLDGGNDRAAPLGTGRSRQKASELTTLLADACAELRRLEACAQDLGGVPALPATTNLRSTEIAALRSLAEEGSTALAHRLRVLGIESAESTLPAPRRANRTSRSVRSLVAVYRKCSRRLCAALQGARRSSDAATAALLRALILRLEKQLWLLDSLSGSALVDRSVLGIFLAC